MSWSWSRPRDIKPTALYEDEFGTIWAADAYGRVLSYDGAAWTHHDTGLETRLNSIWSDCGEVYAVGDGGVILHYDGETWERSQAPYPVDLYEVWGTKLDNLWIVGNAGTILRWADGTWERMSTGTLESMYAI